MKTKEHLNKQVSLETEQKDLGEKNKELQAAIDQSELALPPLQVRCFTLSTSGVSHIVCLQCLVRFQSEIEALQRELEKVVAEQDRAMEECNKKVEKLKEAIRDVKEAHKPVVR